jgi:hypothetical protein
MKPKLLPLSYALLLATQALPVTAGEPAWPKFTDVIDSSGIKFKHSLGDFELNNIVEATGPGCAVFDYDNDGLLDIYFVNGRWHPDISDNRGRSCVGSSKTPYTAITATGRSPMSDKAGVAGIEDGSAWLLRQRITTTTVILTSLSAITENPSCTAITVMAHLAT